MAMGNAKRNGNVGEKAVQENMAMKETDHAGERTMPDRE